MTGGPSVTRNTTPAALALAPASTPASAPVSAPASAAASEDGIQVTVTVGARTVTVAHRQGMSLLQTARFAGLRPPSSCETGSCATCLARVVRGRAVMRNNEALTEDEVAEGLVLTCQAEPVTAAIEVIYE